MKRPWLRRIAIGLGAVVLLLAAAAAVLVATFDANRYKSLAVDWMKSERQRTLVIDGPIKLSFFPRLAITVSKVRLSEPRSDDEFIALDEAALAVEALPLLRRQVVVDRISARGVRATVARDAQGRRSFDDLVAGGSGAAAPVDAAAVDRPMRFDIAGLQLDDLHLRLRDDKSGVAGDVVVQSLSSGRLAPGSNSPVTLHASLRLTRPQPAALTLAGAMTVALDLERGAVALSAMKLDVEGSSERAKAVSISVAGDVSWDGRALTAGPLRLALKRATLGALAFDNSTLDVKRALFSPADERLELDSLQLEARGSDAAQPFELALSWLRLVVAGEQLSGGPLTGRFKTSGSVALTGTFASGAPAGGFKSLRLPGVEADLQGRVGERKVTGSLRADALLHVDDSTAALEPMTLRASLDEPGLAPRQLAVTGDAFVDGRAKSARWKLDGALSTNRFSSEGRASFAKAVPKITASARFDSLDLNQLLATGKSAPAVAAPATPGEADLPLDALARVDGDFKLGAGALAWRQYRVADAQLAAGLAGGVLRIERLTGRIWSGRIVAGGSADANTRKVAVKLDADGIDIQALLRDVAGKDLLEGTGHVVADLASAGTTVAELRSRLGGSAALQLRNGAIKGINLARSLRQARAALSLRQDTVSAASGSEKTDFTELGASARIADGVAQSDDLVVKSPFLRISGAGRFDIGRGRIDYVARATATDAATGQGGAELKLLRGITVPVVLSGPFDAIAWNIQWSEVAAKVIENQLRDRLVDRLGAELGLPKAAGSDPAKGRPKPEDQLRDVFKGLFR